MNPLISFILCSRNDNYMGNPIGRLEIALNYLGKNVQLLGKETSVEVIVTDWGSKTPLKEVLRLNATAAKITRFLEVPVETVKEVQKDSPFAEVLALNAAARRASGKYIGRIDQDTLTGKHFLKIFFEWSAGRCPAGMDMPSSYLFATRRQIPFDFAQQVSSVEQVDRYLRWCGRSLLVEEWGPYYFNSPVGIMILSKDLWMKCGGYDERLLYWGWMEVDLAYRLKGTHDLLDISSQVKSDFYHLEHYDPRLPRKSPRKWNPTNTENLEFHPNGENWGLRQHALTLCDYAARPQVGTPALSDNHRPEQWWFVPAAALLAICAKLCRPVVACAASNHPLLRGIRALCRPAKYPLYARRILSLFRRSS